ncbi:hypothetical protein Q6268_29375, partial [Klebsiella pneumoniae]|nr:hypothetical protein [Klebsiella pneumoniae]
LAQGLLTGKYLNGIPQDSRMHREGNKVRGLTPKMLTEANLNSLRLLNDPDAVRFPANGTSLPGSSPVSKNIALTGNVL